MTISIFLLVGLVILIALLVFTINKTNGTVYHISSLKWFYLIALLVLGLLAVITINNYLYPKDKTVFSNTDYHILEHRGFIFDSLQYFVRGDYPDEALVDDKSGIVAIFKDSIVVQNYTEPFYVESFNYEKRLCGFLPDKKLRGFKLLNNILKDDISDGFTLTQGNDTLYSLKIQLHKGSRVSEKDDKFLYISRASGCVADTSTFTKRINRGIPLNEIISRNPTFELNDRLKALLEGAMLVKEFIPIDNDYGRESSEQNNSKLIFAPGVNFFLENGLCVNGNQINNTLLAQRYVDSTKSNIMFYSGVGQTKTDVFRKIRECNNKVGLSYVLPKMSNLREKDGKLFITSSVENAVESKTPGGYLFNIFDNETNFNHINAQLKYYIGTSQDSMYFEIMDFHADNPAEKNMIRAGEEFYLQSRMVGNSNLHWVFNFNDLSASNSLKWHHLIIFVFSFIVVVVIRVIVDDKYQFKSISFIELSVYVVLFCFSVVRLILGWRMSTFVPIEDIAPTVFAKMHDGKDVWFWTCASLLAPLFFMLFPLFHNKSKYKSVDYVVSLLRNFKNKFSEIANAKHFTNTRNKITLIIPGKDYRIVLLFVFMLIICGIASGVDVLNRLVNIPIPIVLFLLFDLRLATIQSNNSSGNLMDKFPRILLWIASLLYFFIQDAGFSIIFLLFTIIHFGILSKLLLSDPKLENIWYKKKIVIILLMLSALLLFLKYEGNLMIFFLNNISHMLLIFSILIIGGIAVFWKASKKTSTHNYKRLLFFAVLTIFISLAVFSVLDIFNINNKISDIAHEKMHMKYRAELQMLKSTESIDDLMIESDYQSTDVNFILRSAHNQWFINQYNNNKDNSTYFNLKPHFNQGSSYTTQTTDLVIVRYVLAEHGSGVVIWLVTMLLLLIVIYVYESNIKYRKDSRTNTSNFTILGVFTLIFSISLFVFLSSTNRIVFFGQDFPFLSITSKIAVLFPLLLFVVAVAKTMVDNLDPNKNNYKDKSENKFLIFFTLIFISLACIVIIPVKGTGQKEDQFDVTKVIENIQEKINPIDQEFQRFQQVNEKVRLISVDSIWNEYVASSLFDPKSAYSKALSDSVGKSRYFHTLLKNFNRNSYQKANPNEILHLRKRGTTYFFAVNRKHYFIPSMMQQDIKWTGELLAAKSDRLFGFSEISSTHPAQRLAFRPDYEINIIPDRFRDSISNIRISRLDSSWVSDKEPLLLISSVKSQGSRQYYHLESDSQSLKGSSAGNQIATRIYKNDIVILNCLDSKRNEVSVLKWKYGQDDEHFLAKNIWLNGKQQLFYPLGKESMWSYHFANLVRDSYSNHPNYKDTTIRLSIDYDLHKSIYRIIQQDNRNKFNFNAFALNSLNQFKQTDFEKQKNKNNGTNMYLNVESNQLLTTSAELQSIVVKVNEINRKKYRGNDLNKAIDTVLEQQYAFSAVAIDGNGRIRLLFDYNKYRKIDPNNFKYLNKYLSDLYKESQITDERDILGNKALQLINPGPGSSFKPIAYTAVTSQENLNWLSLKVSTQNINFARFPDPEDKDKTEKVFFYGGVDFNAKNEWPWALESYSSGLNCEDYLTFSNNLYHSVMIMLGNQRKGNLTSIFKPAGVGELNFPVFSYENQLFTFDPKKWYKNGNMEVQQGVLSRGLHDNFVLNQGYNESGNLYVNFFGTEPHLMHLFKTKSSNWSYPEAGSQNVADKNLPPVIRNGLIQTALGAYPLQVSPLQMAIMGMRLATLNKAKNITTLADNHTEAPAYEFFNTPGWDSIAYLNFYKNQVLKQLKRVTTIGTARGLGANRDFVDATRNYHVYTKTGTLNVDNGSNERLKHLLVIISNTAIENVNTIEQLRGIKYYSIYLSYYDFDAGQNGQDFNTAKYGSVISEIVNSEQFQKYMYAN